MARTDKTLSELASENNALKREVEQLKNRLIKMQKIFEKQHEEIRELKLKAGARFVGAHRK